MRPYEVMIILDARLEDEVIKTTIDRATQLVTDAGGVVGHVDRWGKRRFAYDVQHRSEGYYAVVEVTAEPKVLDELDRMLGLADEVIRHKVIRIPDQVAGRSRRSPTPDTAAAGTSANGG